MEQLAVDQLLYNSLWGLFGVLLWSWTDFMTTKDKHDDKDEPYKFSVWWNKRWDNFVGSVIFTPVTVFFSPDLWVLIVNQWIGWDVEFLQIMYIASGIVAEVFVFALKKLRSLISAVGGNNGS